MNDLTGHTLGQYTIIEKLGRGGMADVYKGFHPGLSVHRAIKVIRPEFVTAEDFRARFQKEAQAVAGLRHHNIVQMHDFGVQDDRYFMVMEFIEGQDLKKVLQDKGTIRPIERAISNRNRRQSRRSAALRPFARVGASRHQTREHHADTRGGLSS